MNNRPTRTAAVFAIAATLLLLPFAANAAENTPAEKPKPAIELGSPFASQVQQPGVPIGIVTLGAENPPLTWVPHEGMQKAAGFEKQRDDLNLAYPNTDVCKRAVVAYIETVKQYNHKVAALLEAGEEIPTELADRAPAFPEPYYNQWASRTETATNTYNFCISPLTPLAVRGVIWIPGKDNIMERFNLPAAVLPPTMQPCVRSSIMTPARRFTLH